MWSDKDIDNAFHRLNPPDPEPAPFPLDAWLRLETELDKAVLERAVRRRVWQFFAAEVAVVALAVLGWLLWPIGKMAAPEKVTVATTVARGAGAASLPKLSIGKDLRRIALPQRSGIDAVPAAAATTAAEAAGATHLAAETAAADAGKQPVSVKTGAPTTATVATSSTITSKTNSTARLLAAATPAETRKLTRSRRETAHGPAAHQALTAGTASASAARAASASALRKPAHYEVRKTTVATESSAATPATIASPGGYSYSASHAAAHKRWARNATEVSGARSSRASATTEKLRKANAAVVASRIPASEPAGISASPETAATSSAEPAAATAALLPREIGLAPIAAAALPVPLATVASTEMIRPARQPRLFIGLVAAPDVTTVKFADVESPLLNVGITLEYRLTPRLRLSTGVLRAKKQYMARRDDYDWGPYQTLVYKHDFQDVDGNCTVLDIPLNLRYDLLVRPNSRLFGSVGLSSFFMQRERYTYDYEENNMYKVWDGGDIINQNRHLLSILNLSAGYERSLSNHWSLQAEPYLKLPLAGVGAGKVKLTSAGVFLGVKYGF